MQNLIEIFLGIAMVSFMKGILKMEWEMELVVYTTQTEQNVKENL